MTLNLESLRCLLSHSPSPRGCSLLDYLDPAFGGCAFLEPIANQGPPMTTPIGCTPVSATTILTMEADILAKKQQAYEERVRTALSTRLERRARVFQNLLDVQNTLVAIDKELEKIRAGDLSDVIDL